ncbi:MAG TPA: NAD(P)/FAD-dependent oxidoreductase [Xanthobacteraceae bacterium]|nr:NAD(P)/FAD-dependent oxidoreductase [Xanthobacteraceae bacterium]
MPRKAAPQFSRRSFLAAAAALAARPAFGATAPAAPAAGPIDVIIVGAGAAGIAAARRIAGAGRRFVLLEASDHSGGRCITDTRSFGVPYDRGAHWIYTPDLNPLTKLTPRRGIEVYPAPPSEKVRIGRRYAREGELEDFLAAEVRATRAIADAARKADVPCEQVMPNDLADWRSTVEFILGPFGCAKDLAQVSSVDFSKAAERNAATFCRQGFGALLAALADGIAVQLSTPVKAIDSRRNLLVETAKGTLTARAVIVTVSTNVIASGRIQFTPELPHRNIDAFGRLSLGSYDHIALELVGNPLGLESDDLVFAKSADTHTGAMLANVSGTPLCLIDVAGSFGRDLAEQGEAAMVDFAAEWLAGLYGAEIKKAIGRTHATRWKSDAWTLGASSAAVPGGQAARRILMEPVNDAIWFAGEAAHETLWGTVGGAWESGERAADAVLRRLGPLKQAAPPAETEAAPKHKAKRARAEPRVQPREERSPYGTPNIMREER